MADEQELSPEEKLLRVIQKGEPPVAPSTPPVDGGLAASETPAADNTGIASGVPPTGRGIVVLNRLLAAAAALFLLLAGFETYLNVPANATIYAAESIDIGPRSGTSPDVSLSDSLDMFARRRIFGLAERPVVTPGSTNTIILIGWRAYARDNLTLMGMSDVKLMQDGGDQTVREAIVMDNKEKKMHFLRVGSTLVLAEQEVTVSNVDETTIELKKGDEVLIIE